MALTQSFPGPCGKSNLGYMAISKYAGCLQCHGTLRRKDTPPCQAACVSVPRVCSASPCGASDFQQGDLSRFCRWFLCYCMIHPSNLKSPSTYRARKQTPKEHGSLPPRWRWRAPYLLLWVSVSLQCMLRHCVGPPGVSGWWAQPSVTFTASSQTDPDKVIPDHLL